MTIRGMLSVCACFVMYLVSGVVGVVVPEHQSVALRLVCPVRRGCLVDSVMDSVGGGVGRYP